MAFEDGNTWAWFDWSVYPKCACYNFQPEDFFFPKKRNKDTASRRTSWSWLEKPVQLIYPLCYHRTSSSDCYYAPGHQTCRRLHHVYQTDVTAHVSVLGYQDWQSCLVRDEVNINVYRKLSLKKVDLIVISPMQTRADGKNKKWCPWGQRGSDRGAEVAACQRLGHPESISQVYNEFQKLNHISKFDAYPMPWVEEVAAVMKKPSLSRGTFHSPNCNFVK